ncbi:MAG: pellicle/biofilm biosynthesis protein PelD [Nitrosospira sp.]
MKKPWLEGIEIVNVNSPDSAWGGWLETFILTALVIAASFATQQDHDPFRLGGGFPWPILAPLLAGLRYGFAYGFVSALLILATLGVAINQQWQQTAGFPLAWSLGAVAVAMVAGEFRDMWGRRLHRLEGAYQYRAERLEEFTRNYQLLRLSHDRLEQAVANSGFSLREGIMHLQPVLEAAGAEDRPAPAAFQSLIEFLADYGAVTQACIAGISTERLDATQVLAQVGERFEIDPDDPVLAAALESGELATVNLAPEEVMDQGQLLAAIPLADSTGEIHAMLLVRSMPFFAFHENNLRLIAVLAAHGIDHLRFGAGGSSVTRFITSFERAYQDFSRFKLDASLLTLSGNPSDVLAAYDKLRSMVRAIDIVCIARRAGHPVALVLIPLTPRAGAQTWMDRTGDVPGQVSKELISIQDADPQAIRSLEEY